jgi:hypothetical protein
MRFQHHNTTANDSSDTSARPQQRQQTNRSGSSSAPTRSSSRRSAAAAAAAAALNNLLLERADSVRPASYLAAAGVGHIAIVDADTTCNEKSLMERRRLELQSVNRPNG